jgi:hypothetical protein
VLKIGQKQSRETENEKPHRGRIDELSEMKKGIIFMGYHQGFDHEKDETCGNLKPTPS